MGDSNKELRTARISTASRLSATTGGAAWLILYHRDGAKAVPLHPGVSLTVGREEPADVVVNDTSLSRQHARFTWNGKEVKVEDLGSTNGTWFGEEPVETATVHVGQELTLGAVMAAIQSPAGAAATELGLDSHDRFMALLETEIVRAKFFGRPFSVAMIRALQPSARHLRHWAPALRARLRPVDRAALYSPDVLEIAIQEIDADQARE
ncbi:MAG TPA: FHA domain-containing protein, partial [Polyangiaceae bacterium]|nr:FHA domain-containing protein [Polyangiaceae bacterium]